ncbi:MAG: sulfotransferase [Myxococcota bacterium]
MSATAHGSEGNDGSRGKFDLSGSHPAWLRRVNAVGRALTGSGAHGAMAVPLDVASLLAEARANTGLDDFGPDDGWREGLEVLAQSLDREARLTLVGRLLARADVVNALETRLQVEDAYRRDPSIDDEEVAAPLFIVGLPRSGTSILHELLAQDPAHRVPLSWEARHPCPPPEEATYDTDPRIERCEAYVQFWNELVPEYRTMHEMGARIPCECIWLTMPTFVCEEWIGRQQCPGYAAWYMGADLRPAYAYHRRLLKLLQHRFRRERWMLKAPSHMAALDVLLAEYPDARILMTHRDPLKSMGSTASILSALAWMRSEDADIGAIRAGFGGEGMAYRLDVAMRAREAADPSRFFDVRYQDMLSDPFGTIARAYAHFGIPYTKEAERRMRDYLAAKPQAKHGAHAYSFDDLGLDVATERARFAAYQERFGVPSEVA